MFYIFILYLSLLIKLHQRWVVFSSWEESPEAFLRNVSRQGPTFLDVSIYVGPHDRVEARHQLQLQVQFF